MGKEEERVGKKEERVGKEEDRVGKEEERVGKEEERVGKEEDSGICITCMQARFQAKIKFSTSSFCWRWKSLPHSEAFFCF